MEQAPSTSERVFDYICQYLEQHGYAPSIRDIAQACHLGSSTVFYTLHKLEAWGWICREPMVARSLRVQRSRIDEGCKN